MMGGGWVFGDHLDDLLYPSSRWEAIKGGLMTLLFFIPIILMVIPLSFIISFFCGLSSPSPKRKCDCCGRYKLNNVRSIHKFYWFCGECSDKYDKVTDKLMKKCRKQEQGVKHG